MDHAVEPPGSGQDAVHVGFERGGQVPSRIVEEELSGLDHDADLLAQLEAQGGQPNPQRLVALVGQGGLDIVLEMWEWFR
jgi:hypothetical protein